MKTLWAVRYRPKQKIMQRIFEKHEEAYLFIQKCKRYGYAYELLKTSEPGRLWKIRHAKLRWLKMELTLADPKCIGVLALLILAGYYWLRGK